jgi:GNAT superfamily N-acetyltransferase
MTDPFQFRIAAVSDAGAISRLILDMAPSVTADPAGRGAAPFLATLTPEAIAANLSSERFRYHLAWEGGVLAGVIGIRDASHLFHLFVSPDHQSRGLGTRLWQLGREAALAAGNPGHFTVNATPAAQQLYERFGFRECGKPIEHSGVRAIPMEWRE